MKKNVYNRNMDKAIGYWWNPWSENNDQKDDDNENVVGYECQNVWVYYKLLLVETKSQTVSSWFG